MILKVDTSINEKTAGMLKESKETLDSSIKGSLTSDFNSLTQLGIFSSQLENLQKAINSLSTFQENFISVVEENTYQWGDTVNNVKADLNSVNDGTVAAATSYKGSGTRNTGYRGGNSGGTAVVTSGYSSSDLGAIYKGTSVKTATVSDFIDKLDSNTIPILLKRLYELNGNKSIIDLLVDKAKSGALLVYLKKVLGDTTTDLDETSTEESDAIQKKVLEKVNVEEVDIETEEGKTELEKVVIEDINKAPQDESKMNEIIYGDNTTKVNLLDGNWVVAKTKSNLQEYASYIDSQGVRQTVDGKYSDYCLAFSYVHAYDLFTGSRGSANDAGNYAHAAAFEDYIDDDKNKVLAKIYDEIMNGRPVVLQVNGNKAGTVRHFVTVVGFREGITSADALTEKDLLIVDSWDGKIERMDTASSRFMTSGKDCNKEYSGYRLRVLKQNVA